MSHQTGALLMTSEFQTTELMKWFKHAKPVQIMYRQVPVFEAGWHVRACTMLQYDKVTFNMPWKGNYA